MGWGVVQYLGLHPQFSALFSVQGYQGFHCLVRLFGWRRWRILEVDETSVVRLGGV